MTRSFLFWEQRRILQQYHNAPNLLLLKRDKGSESETNLSLSHNIYPKFATIIMSFSSSSLLRASLRLSSTAAARCTTPGVAAPRLVCVAGSSRRFQHTLQDSYEYINVEKKDGGVGVITLNRPKALNALCDDLFADLVHAGKALDADNEIGCMVLTGSTKAFAAGADISEMKDRTFDYAYQTVRNKKHP
jgi:hypothetical protein